MIEILCNGRVHYRRPNDRPDVAEARRLIESGAAPTFNPVPEPDAIGTPY